MSPPVRGAWVEICLPFGIALTGRSRPLCGGRGLKFFYCKVWPDCLPSPPVRGAWVEICWVRVA